MAANHLYVCGLTYTFSASENGDAPSKRALVERGLKVTRTALTGWIWLKFRLA